MHLQSLKLLRPIVKDRCIYKKIHYLTFNLDQEIQEVKVTHNIWGIMETWLGCVDLLLIFFNFTVGLNESIMSVCGRVTTCKVIFMFFWCAFVFMCCCVSTSWCHRFVCDTHV